MRPILVLSVVLLAACGSKNSSVKFGQTTRSDIVALKQREPDKEHKIPLKDGSVMDYGDEVYQLKGERVTDLIKTPKGDETQLIYWKHRFKNCKTSEQALPVPADTHVPGELQLNCDELGEAVVYTIGSDLVKKVLVYEAK